MTCSLTRKTILVGALAALALGAWSGCAEQRDAIDRVQPYALEKSFFVGPDLTDPKDDPEFWTQATLIDVGYGAAQDGLFTSTYAQPMSRLRWQITEDLLLGRLAYERIANSDGKGAGQAVNDGVLVVVFKIEKHFDIVRAYNPTTGERLNILEENSSDRPWYEREYLRVDWSKNLNTDSYDFDTLSLLGVYGGITYEPLAYDVTDPSDPNAPHFDTEGGYFDVTNKAFAQPEVVDLSHLGWGIDSFPACFLPADFSGGTYPAGSCNPVELTIRHSFRRVVDSDYEPVDWDGYRFQAYGGFYVERYGYARNYGMSDQMWHRFLNRYQIWKRSHSYADPEAMTGPVECFTPQKTPFGEDPHRDYDHNGTEDECEAVGPGSRCDTFRQRCTLPYTQREPITIAWYYTNSAYPELFDATEMAAHEWDVALRVAVRTAQYAECNTTGQADCASRFPVYFGQQDDNLDAVQLAREVDDCRTGLAYAGRDCDRLADEIGQQRGVDPGVIAIAQMPEMIVLCHSPVQADDPSACGDRRLPPGYTTLDCVEARENGDLDRIEICEQAQTVRMGDLRYHQINVIEQPQSPSPWGIYTDSEDPLTGETIAASVNTWAWVNDYYSQLVVDKLRLIKGELTPEDVTEATYVHDWSQAAEAAAGHGVLPQLTRDDLAEQVARFTGGSAETIHLSHDGHEHASPLPESVRQRARQLKSELSGVRAALGEPSVFAAEYAARRLAAEGTAFEAGLMTPMFQQLMGIAGMPINQSILDLASPLRGANPSLHRQLYHLREQALGKRGACILHPTESLAPISMTGLADALEEKFGRFNPSDSPGQQQQRAERMRRFVAHRAQFAVIAHEMGHSLGMRHNFVSSSDAWGYRPQYWQLRTRDGQETQRCASLTTDGTSCIGPRYFDPVTREEEKNLIWMFMQSTVMDYPGEFTQDMIGLGAYDFASMRMFYGGVASVHADTAYNASAPKGKSMLAKMDNFGGILGIQHGRWNAMQRSLIDFHYSELQNEYRLIRDCGPVDVDDFKPARWNTERDGTWHPLLDGLIVSVGGQHTRCRQEQVDHVPWTQLRLPLDSEKPGYYRGGPAVDAQGRTRMPYGFATDSWADLGNLSVYRHDNGADAYEIFNFFVTSQEVDHIFDNYRRGRTSFSVRSAANRTLSRYNEKLRDGAKGLGLMKNIYEDFALEIGYDFDTLWPYIAGEFFPDNVLASGLAFDHFARQLARPEIGDHYYAPNDPVLRSSRDAIGAPATTQLVVHNGATGLYGDISLGGKAVENMLAEDQGEYDRDYTINAGSYYDKLNTAMLMTESVDNFISSSRRDFVDPRYRAVSLADLFPEGYRRWLANNLTADDLIKGPRVATDASGRPLVDALGYPSEGFGWTSWWGDEPKACFPAQGTTVCASYSGLGEQHFNPRAPQYSAPIDPQVGWEQQKFLIAWTLLYLPENERINWLDLMRLWELGKDADPGFANRIEFHNPSGRIYVAKTFGKETIFGKSVQRGIAARVLESANELLVQAYQTTDGPDLDGDGLPDWYQPVFSPDTGLPVVLFDSGLDHIRADGTYLPGQGSPGCNANDNSQCTCASNRWCVALERYNSVPAYLREALDAYQLGQPEERGVY